MAAVEDSAGFIGFGCGRSGFLSADEFATDAIKSGQAVTPGIAQAGNLVVDMPDHVRSRRLALSQRCDWWRQGLRAGIHAAPDAIESRWSSRLCRWMSLAPRARPGLRRQIERTGGLWLFSGEGRIRELSVERDSPVIGQRLPTAGRRLHSGRRQVPFSRGPMGSAVRTVSDFMVERVWNAYHVSECGLAG